MSLVDYASILLRRGWVMLLLATLTAVGAFVFSRTMTPVYRSSQTILLIPSRSDWGLTQAAIGLLNNRQTYLNSDIVAARIVDKLQLDMSPSALRANTTIAPNRENLAIQIDVDMPAPSAEEAARLLNPIAEAWGQELILWQDELNNVAQREDRIRAQAADNPRLSLLRPNLTINTAIGGVAGLFVGAIIVFVLEFLESSVIRRRDDLERGMQLKVLASVPIDSSS